MRKLLLIGGGGHCHSVLDSVLNLETYEQIAIVDKNSCAGTQTVPVIGQDKDLAYLFHSGWREAFIAIGSVGNTSKRRWLYSLATKIGFSIPNIIDPSAIIAKDVQLKQGIFVGKRAFINARSRIGECAIINSGAIVEHDCIIGEFVHVSPGTVLCGQVQVENDAHVGAGSVVRQQIKIGSRALVGIGSVVVKDIPKDARAYGNPCKVMK